jgi:hypothetical protein
VLDNVDDASFLLGAPAAGLDTAARPLREYLPHCSHGAILVTTRNNEAALKLVEQRDIIRLQPMSEAQSLVLLGKKLGALADNNVFELAELAVALECCVYFAKSATVLSDQVPKRVQEERAQADKSSQP